VPPGIKIASKSSAVTSATISSAFTLWPSSRPFLPRIFCSARSSTPTIVTTAPASSRARFGSNSSDSSNPSPTSAATRLPSISMAPHFPNSPFIHLQRTGRRLHGRAKQVGQFNFQAAGRIEHGILQQGLQHRIALEHVAFGDRVARVDLAHVDTRVETDLAVGQKVERVEAHRVHLEREQTA